MPDDFQFDVLLSHSSKDKPVVRELAEQLRKETTMTLKWIAEHLHIGTRGHLAHLLYWHRRTAEN